MYIFVYNQRNIHQKNNMLAKKQHGKTFSVFFRSKCCTQNLNWIFFMHVCYFSGEHFNICNFFYGRLRTCKIFRCVQIYWMFFLVPITTCHVFPKNKFIITLNSYWSGRTEHRRYLMFKIILILTVHVLLIHLIQGLI